MKSAFYLAFCLFVVTSLRAQNENLECGQRPFCAKFPWLCGEFVSNLLRNFLPGEIPFLARITVTERNESSNNATNTTLQCVAVILSQQDLLVNSKCFQLSRNGSIALEQGLSFPYDNLKGIFVNSNIALLTLLQDKVSLSSTDSYQNACAEAMPEFAFNGVVCGFASYDMSNISCRALRAANSEAMLDASDLVPSGITDLKEGAVVFRRFSFNQSDGGGGEVWKVVGFTNADGDILALSPQDCDGLSSFTKGRVACAGSESLATEADKRITETMNAIAADRQRRSAIVAADQQAEGGSALVPAILFCAILLLGIMLCVVMVRNSRFNSAYDMI